GDDAGLLDAPDRIDGAVGLSAVAHDAHPPDADSGCRASMLAPDRQEGAGADPAGSRGMGHWSNMPLGVSPARKGSMKPSSRSTWPITAVWEVAGSTARREAGRGTPISPIS